MLNSSSLRVTAADKTKVRCQGTAVDTAEQGTLKVHSATENKLAKLSQTTFLALWEQLKDCKTRGTFNKTKQNVIPSKSKLKALDLGGRGLEGLGDGLLSS